MATKSKQQLMSRIFADVKHYPRGFRRSGDFSIKEADALEQYGNLIIALEKGLIDITDQDDEHLVSVLRGQAEAATLAEKAWLKYVKLINRPKLGSLYGNKKVQVESNDDESVPAEDFDDEPLSADLDTADESADE